MFYPIFVLQFFVCNLAYADALGSLETPFRKALEGGNFFLALGLVFLAGLATSLTPCVYPMIAITVSVFGAREARSHWHGAGLSLAFVLGMAALFTPLGLFAALTGGLFGAALSHPVVLSALALVFIAMAASMFGAFELTLPASVQNKLAHVGGVGPKGAFVLGFVSGLIAAPCTGPVLGFLLTWVSTTQQLGFGALSLFVYSLGLGLLFFVVGTFSIALPKSGRWLEWIKSVFGIVMLVVALYYLRDLIPGFRNLAEKTSNFLFGALGLTLVGLLLGAVHLTFHHTTLRVRAQKALGIVCTVVGVAGLIGYAEALPPGAKIVWMSSYDVARKKALAEHKPLLVDFTASWCGACGELDRLTFSDARVVKEAQRFIAVRVDMSPGLDTAENKAALAGYQARGLPLVVMHGALGNTKARVQRFIEAAAFLRILKSVN